MVSQRVLFLTEIIFGVFLEDFMEEAKNRIEVQFYTPSAD